MDFSKKGWLSVFLELKEDDFEREMAEKLKKGFHPDHALYAMIQPTGLMYGYPLKKMINAQKVSGRSQVKLLLIDTLLICYFLFNKDLRNKDIPVALKIQEALNDIVVFYNAVFPELHTSMKNFFGQKKNLNGIVETLLDKRVEMGKDADFWAGFFQNSLLFLDIYLLRQWVQTSNSKMIIDYLRSERDEIQSKIIKAMSASAYANKNIEPEEKQLFEHFISTVRLSSEKKKEARKFFAKGYTVNELELPIDDNWILKKYFLELSILTAWADRRVEDLELEYLESMNKRLGFMPEEFETSMIAVEGFVLDYWNELEKLQSKKEYEFVSHHFINRIEKVIINNREPLYEEIYRRGNLLKLIVRAKTGEVSEKERDFIKDQIIDAFEAMPAFEIIHLPRNFLSVELLISLLPNDFYKSISQTG